MSGTCSTFQLVKAQRSCSQGNPAQFRLKQNTRRTKYSQIGGGRLAFGAQTIYKPHSKNLQRMMSYSEGVLEQTSEPTYDTQTTQQNEPSNIIDDGALLLALGDGDAIFEYLQGHFLQDDGSFDAVAAMAYLERVFSMFQTLPKKRNRNVRIASVYENVIDALKDSLAQLSLSDKVVCMSSLGVVNNIIYTSTVTFQNGLIVFKQLLQDVLNEKDSLSTEEVCSIATSLTYFKQYTDLDNIQLVLDAIRSQFFNASTQEKFTLLDIVRQMRCYDDEIFLSAQQGIMDGTLVPETEENIQQVLQFLGAIGECSDRSVLTVLVDRYLEIPNRESRDVLVNAIFNLAWLGADQSLVQKVVDETLGGMDVEEQVTYTERFCVGMLRRANSLMQPRGSVVLPQLIQNIVSEREYVNQRQMRPNPTLTAVNSFLGANFEDCKTVDRPVVGGDMRADMSIEKGDKKLVISTRLPTSFTLTEPRKLLGYTKASFQQLENKGWKVFVVEGDKFVANEDGYQDTIREQIRNIIDSEDDIESNWKSM
eukprot:TRINITY_DN710_c0_g1_i14.p1 TRINITY_DN710_c0_g1~~TRINITY_DN710_c0_g1_i14.p1  ORF type:complete len:536 (-),score=95.10 TRINITY_DN710_c0_g1_i14:462-2069(-)